MMVGERDHQKTECTKQYQAVVSPGVFSHATRIYLGMKLEFQVLEYPPLQDDQTLNYMVMSGRCNKLYR